MRALLVTLVLLSMLSGSPVLAAPSESVHELDWFVHVDLVTVSEDIPFWTSLIAERLAEADVLIQGHQGPVDNGCCVVLDAVTVSTFGSSGDGLDAITSQGELNSVFGLGAGAYLVDMIHFCNSTFSTGIRGCALTPGDVLIVGLEADDIHFLPAITAHERGHNAGLNHVSANPCELMSASNGGGCLSISECNAFISDADSSGGSCECLPDTQGDPPLSTSNTCSDTSGCGICGGGVCGACNGLGNVRLLTSS